MNFKYISVLILFSLYIGSLFCVTLYFDSSYPGDFTDGTMISPFKELTQVFPYMSSNENLNLMIKNSIILSEEVRFEGFKFSICFT